MKSLLNVGSDGRSALPTLQLSADEWTETHFDMRDVSPGSIVGDVLELNNLVNPKSFDIVFCSHMLEHIDPWNVITVLNNLRHAVKDDGQVVVVVPDIEEAARAIVETHSVMTEMYKSIDDLHITARDMIFGYADMVKDGIDAMRHRSAFTINDLAAIAVSIGLTILRLEKRPAPLEVMLVYR